MAEGAPKSSKPAAPKDTMILDSIVVIGMVIILYVGNNVTPVTFETVFSGEAPAILLSHIVSGADVSAIQGVLFSIENILGVLAIVFLAGIFWTMIKIREIHHAEHKKYEPIHVEEITAHGKMIQWKVVLEHVTSENPAEWKLAILEADNMLDEILEDMGYAGDTVAEKLKTMSRTKVASYDNIWEAHKVRNEIAHGGAIDMELTKKTARDTVAKFGNAFKELGYL
ncbi:MAG: hypothetical protein HZB12_00995 [Candidatus Yonathbacteria bacterium]|nr:hypothetical protein [Candidatus Yonathbacteria bacterium]